ncbi:MAG: hypothetical protein M1130_02780 [Actinobacteria bacterium]|nr:hypothetical protein [Actinomycetota bacterium]
MNYFYPGAEERHGWKDNNPKWNESYFFDFYDPKSTVGAYIRIGINEYEQSSGIWLILFKDRKPLYNRVVQVAPYTPKRMADPDGVEVANLRFTSIEPLKKALVEYSNDQTSLSLTFEATAPMADAFSITKKGIDDVDSFVHLEGPTRVNGTLNLRGEKIEIVDGLGFRDVHWGIRDWEFMYTYRLSWPVFTNGQTVAIVHTLTITGKRAYMKMVWDGKEWLPIREVEDNIEFAEDGMTVKSLHYRFWDCNDRLWEYTAKPFYCFMIPVDGFLVAMNWGEYRLSDGTVGYGPIECGFRLPWDPSYFTPGPTRKDCPENNSSEKATPD